MNKLLIPAALATACAFAFAKLPPPDDATKAKAAETAAKTAWQNKVAAWQLCKSQDKVASRFRKTSAPATAAAAPKDPKAPAAASGATTPVATNTLPPAPCAEPGPFAYNQPAQKPLETSGAHSPTGTAATPPSVRQNSAQMAPAKK